ncbi:unnamed protein product [Symbiodinium sp. KB8]|nr:unnamed protein product [Symbiodinium sp. KB8]
MYQELQEPEPIRSMGFLRELDRLHSTGHEPRLPKTFEQYGLQAPVPVTYENIGLEEYHPTLRLRSMIETLSRVDGKIDHLLVGNGPAELRSFWCNYRKLHPQHDVFNDHATRLDACVPMMLHLDEGTSLKKKAIMVLSVQPVCGRGSRKSKSTSMGINFTGSTFCTRFLYSVLLARTYITRKKILYDLLEHWQQDLNDCYQNGIEIDGVAGLSKVWPVVINCKGDWPALTKAGRLTRHHLRDAPMSDSPPGVCHLCRAGQRHFAWNEFESNARWLHADNPLPWTVASPLAKLPQDRGNIAGFYCIDLFHAAHKGVVGDYAASVTLLDYDIVGTGHFTKRLDTCFAELRGWCKATGHNLHMTGLTKNQIGLDTAADFPVASLGVSGACFRRWFKGNDTTIIVKFLEAKYKQALADCLPEIEDVLATIYDGLVAINKFMKSVYAQPLWVQPEVAGDMYTQGMTFMRAFNSAAATALARRLPRFKYMPKFHLMAHIFHSMKHAWEKGVVSMNVLSHSCQMDEDFIGRVAGQSRFVSIRTVHDRTVQRYLLNLAVRW